MPPEGRNKKGHQPHSTRLKPSRKTESKETALSGKTTRRSRSMKFCLGLALVAATLLLYAPSVKFSFINYDDDDYVFNNPHVLSGLKVENVVWAFRTGHASNWHPLTWISHMIDCQLFGTNPGPPHLVNSLFHSANALLLFLVLLRMTNFLWRSFIVAALFALHPLHVESVAWIAERKDVLSTFFWFLTILAYQFYVKQTNLCRYALVVFFFTLGLMAKPMVVTLPCVLLLLDYWPLDRFRSAAHPWRVFYEKLPLFALSAASCFITIHVQKTWGAIAPLESLPLIPRLENALLSYYRYLADTFYPSGLTIPYRYDLDSQSVAIGVAGIVLVIITITVIILGNRHKYLPVGWFWYLGTLVPAIGIVQVGDQAAADRYTYIPSVGIFLLVTWGLAEAFQQRHVPRSMITALVVVVLVVCAALSSHQLGFWKNSESLFKHSLTIDPENLDTQDNLAWSYAADPNPELRNGPEALRVALHCVKLTHHRSLEYLETLAAAYAECGQFQSAVQAEEEALALPAASTLPDEVISDCKTRLESYKSGKTANAR